jgi:hypothetical protein
MKPFLENKGIIAELKRGNSKFYQRSELVDIVGFENEKDFVELLKSWERTKTKETEAEASVSLKEDTNVT